MMIFFYIALSLTVFCVITLLCAPFLLRPSQQARRILDLEHHVALIRITRIYAKKARLLDARYADERVVRMSGVELQALRGTRANVAL